MNRVSLRQIAAAANVSEATASRVLNNRSNVSPLTRDRVLVALRQLGGTRQPNLLIGLVVPETRSTFFSTFSFELDQECERRNAHLFVANSDLRADREDTVIGRFCDFGVRGIVFTAIGPSTVETILAHPEVGSRVPLVAFDRSVDVDSFDFVTCSSRNVTREALVHLIEHGHTRIGYIRGLKGATTAADRYASFVYWMNHFDLPIRQEWILQGDFQAASGRRCGQALIAMPKDARPTAIVAGNDTMAVTMMQQLQKAGWSLPRDLSVIGFDGIPVSDWTFPRLTTMRQPLRRLAQVTMQLLYERIQEIDEHVEDRMAAQRISIEGIFTSRDSVTRPAII